MDNKLQKGINKIKELRLTADEKNRIFASVINSGVSTRLSLKSPWASYAFFAKIRKSNFITYGVAVLFILFTTGGIVFASTESLPDSILYPIKVSVVEPIISKLKFNQEDKAQYESNLSTKRLIEAETLANKGKLDPANEKKINILLANHTIALDGALDKISKNKSSEKTNEIVTNFNAQMNAHAQVLDIIIAHENKQDQPISDNQISKMARINADKIINILKNKKDEVSDTNKKDEVLDKYKNKKDNIQAIIDSTTADLNKTDNNKSHIRQKVVNDTNITLDQAKQFLFEADENKKDGNSEDAYLKLIDSEVSAKEAKIFLKAGLKFNININQN